MFLLEKQSVILKSEALRAEKINHALGEAESMRLQAEARAAAIEKIAIAINSNVSHKPQPLLHFNSWNQNDCSAVSNFNNLRRCLDIWLSLSALRKFR